MNKIKKRRMKKKLMQNKIKIIFLIVLSFSFLLGSGYAILNQRLDLGGSVTIGNPEFVCENNITGNLIVNSSWGNNDGTQTFDTTLKIKNEGAEDILDWVIKIKGPSDLIVQTNANVTYGDDGVITLTPYSWNSIITTDNEFSLGIGFITVETEFNLEYLVFNGCMIYGTNAPDEEEPEPEDPDIELTGLEISPSSYTMNIGDTLALQVTKTPDNASADLVWTSSDSNIVSVTEDGVITGVNIGYATITVTSGTIKASTTITVEEESTPPTSSDVQIVFKNTDNYWQNGDGTYSMNFSITMTNNSENSIDKLKFTLVMPENTKYSVWHDSVTVSGNDFTYAYTLESGASTIVYGQLTWPSDTNADDYIIPQITNIIANSSSTNNISQSNSLPMFSVSPPSNSITNQTSQSNVDIKFNKVGEYWSDGNGGYQMNFNIAITNNSSTSINSVQFTLNAPSGTTYSIWSGNTIVQDNIFTYSNLINSKDNTIINGQIYYPSGTDISNYLELGVTNIIVN